MFSLNNSDSLDCSLIFLHFPAGDSIVSSGVKYSRSKSECYIISLKENNVEIVNEDETD